MEEIFTYYIDKLLYIKKYSTGKEVKMFITKDDFEKIILKMQRLITSNNLLIVDSSHLASLGALINKFRVIVKFLLKEGMLLPKKRGEYEVLDKKTFTYDAERVLMLFEMKHR